MNSSEFLKASGSALLISTTLLPVMVSARSGPTDVIYEIVMLQHQADQRARARAAREDQLSYSRTENVPPPLYAMATTSATRHDASSGAARQMTLAMDMTENSQDKSRTGGTASRRPGSEPSAPDPQSATQYEEGMKAYKRNDFVTSLKLLRSAAELGHVLAQNNLGAIYASGRGAKSDDTEAVRWYRKAAEQGYAKGQNNLGYMYDSGRGVAKDEATAVRWYRKAAEQGHAQAQNNLGAMFADGRGVKQEEGEAVRWYRRAAEQGNADAQYNLGVMYANGRGVNKDEAEAVKYYLQAAEQSHAKAQNNLGYMYDNGRGVIKDEAEAARWYRKAAEQGLAQAKSELQRRDYQLR